MNEQILSVIKKKAEAHADSIHFCDVDFNNDEEKKFYLIGHPDGLEKLYQCFLDGYTSGQVDAIEKYSIGFAEWLALNYVPVKTANGLKHWQYDNYQNKAYYYTTEQLLLKYMESELTNK